MMKNFKLLFVALMTLAMFVSAHADELTVFEGTDVSENVPIRSYYYDTQDHKVQTILPESEFLSIVGASITSMKFYIADAAGNQMNGGKLAVSIGQTALNSFPSFDPSFSSEELTQVAEITMTPGGTEVVIDFDEPWVYEGGNIMIQTTVVETGNYPHVFFLGHQTSVLNAVFGKGVIGATGFYPMTTFTYTGGVEDLASVAPAEINFGELYPEEQAVEAITVKNIGKNVFTPVFSGIQAPFSIEDATEVASGETKTFNVTFAPTALGEYNQTLTIDCGAAGQFEVALSGAQIEVPTVVVVADGNALNSYLPVYSFYYDTPTSCAQMIYPDEMLTGLEGKKISTVTFHSNGPIDFGGGKLQLSFKEVEQVGFTGYTLLTDLTTVATLVPTKGDADLTFVLDEPYEYNGGNLLIECLMLQQGSYGNVKFLGVNTDYYPSLYYYGSSSSDVDHFLPKTSFSFVKEDTPEPQILRGDVNGDDKVSIADVTALIDYLLGIAPEINPDNADCSLDNRVSIADVTALIDYLLFKTWD